MDPDRADPGPPEFAPRRVTQRSWQRQAAAVVALGTLIVLAAVLTKGAPSSLQSPVPSLLAQARLTAAASPPASPSRPLPSTVACHELDRGSCVEIIRAALADLPPDVPEASGASAWASLLCNSSIDCPPADLANGTPRGSVVVSFTDGGPVAWVNVVDYPLLGSPGTGTRTWIVRWQDVAPPTPNPSRSPGAPDRLVRGLVVR